MITLHPPNFMQRSITDFSIEHMDNKIRNNTVKSEPEGVCE